MNIRIRICHIFLVFLFMIIMSGCVTLRQKVVTPTESLSEHKSSGTGIEAAETIPSVQIREFVLSPGDEISISVLGYSDLSRKFIIPPDGRFFYPIVGEVDVKGKTLKQLREILSEGLASFKEVTLLPGDEIAITVYRNEELNRRLIIPPERNFFYPLIGEIDTQNRNVSDVRKIITTGLSKFLNDPQVSVDIVAYSQPRVVGSPQVSIEVSSLGGQKIFVLGEVNKPGVFTLESSTDVVEAISRAEGFTLEAKQGSVLVIRGGLAKPELSIVQVDKFLKGTDMTQNITLQRGDIVYVPASTIANVDRFFQHFSTILKPIVTLESGIVLAPSVKDVFIGAPKGGTSVIVAPQ